ncbi:hypothetical protein NCS52_00674000 [Fusarium sp. LHS14.1]|nr:hypothetical protein NCS52_00674000 [Fusarium sp. LHS14.1]
MAILSYLYSWVKPRQSRQDEQSKTFTFIGKKKRTKSDIPKVDEEEDHQRQIMIRKSLQSRASSRATDRVEFEDGDTEEEEHNPGLKSDWKAYEADIQRNRSKLMRIHPGVDRSRARAGSSSKRPQPYPSSSANPQSPTLSITPESPASPGIGRAF